MNRCFSTMAFVAVAALASSPAFAAPKQLGKGEIEFRSKCAVCHGVDG